MFQSSGMSGMKGFITNLWYAGKDQDGVTERLATGRKLLRGADDPLGTVVSSGLQTKIRGIGTAIRNMTESVNLLRTADTVLGEVESLYLRINKLSVRGAGLAATTDVGTGSANEDPTNPVRSVLKEILHLQVEVYRKATACTFNEKKVFGDYAAPNGQIIQIGGANDSTDRLEVEIPDLQGWGLPSYVPPPGNITADQYATEFRLAMDNSKARLEEIAENRANLGVLEKRLSDAIDNLNQQYVQDSAMNSRIVDADIAEEMTEKVKSSVVHDRAISTFVAALDMNSQKAFDLLALHRDTVEL